MSESVFTNGFTQVFCGIGLVLSGLGTLFMWKTCLKYMLVPMSGGVFSMLASLACLLLRYQQFTFVGLVRYLAGEAIKYDPPTSYNPFDWLAYSMIEGVRSTFSNPEFIYTLYVYLSLSIAGMVVGLVAAWFPLLAKYVVAASFGTATATTIIGFCGIENKYIVVSVMGFFVIGLCLLIFILLKPPFDKYIHLIITHLMGMMVLVAGIDCFTDLGYAAMYYFVVDSDTKFSFSFVGFGLFIFSLILGAITCGIDIVLFN